MSNYLSISKNKSKLLVCAIAISTYLSTGTSYAQALISPAQEIKLKETMVYFLGPSGNGSEEKAAEGFNAMLKQDPKNPLIMVYAGSATTKLATTTMMPWKKMSYAEDGMAMIDKSLQLLNAGDAPSMHGKMPLPLEVRWVAANTFLAVPGFMNRGVKGGKLLTEVLEDKQFPELDLSFRGIVWVRAAALAISQNHTADAKKFLALAIENKTPSSSKATAMLQELAK